MQPPDHFVITLPARSGAKTPGTVNVDSATGTLKHITWHRDNAKSEGVIPYDTNVLEFYRVDGTRLKIETDGSGEPSGFTDMAGGILVMDLQERVERIVEIHTEEVAVICEQLGITPPVFLPPGSWESQVEALSSNLGRSEMEAFDRQGWAHNLFVHLGHP